MTNELLRDRVSSVCGALGYKQAQTPFSWDLQPTGEIDGVFRIELDADEVIGGFNYTEERTDLCTIWLARKHNAQPEATYRALLTESNSIRAAIIRGAHVTSGEYIVPDGWGVEINREQGKEFAVLRASIPINYETIV